MDETVRQLNKALQENPFDAFMQFTVVQADADGITLVFDNAGTTWDNPNGTLYGGVLYAQAASAMEAACAVLGKDVLTLDLGMNYLRPAFRDTTIEARAKVIHNGRTTMVVLCDLYDNQNRYLAHGKGTFYVTGSFVLEEEC